MDENQSLKKLRRSELEDQVKMLVDMVNENQVELLHEKRKNSLLEKVLYQESKNEIVNEFFKDLSVKDTSSIRLVFLESDYFLQKISFSSGTYSDDYALLDDQIIEQIGVKNSLVVQDTSRIHNIRFFQGYSYPRSLMAFPVLENNIKIGIVWIGDMSYQAFSKQNFEHCEKIIGNYHGPLALLIKKEFLEAERRMLQQIVHEDERPTIIINSNQKIVYANNSAINEFDLKRNENSQNFTGEIDFSIIFELSDQLEKPAIKYNGKEYEVVEIKNFENLNEPAICCRFIDKTWELAKNKYFATIISMITHYIKAPMVEIKGMASLISSLGNLSEKQLGFLSQMNNNIKTIENSIFQLLSVNRIQQEGFVELSKFSIDECVNTVIEILTPFAEQKQITIISNLGKNGEFITSDKILLKHALLNILDYAIKETHIGGAIEINHLITPEKHSIAISDSGKGISMLDVKKMMEGIDSHQKRDELEITKDIMMILNGDLLIESDLGSGTTITLQFPQIT
ncbi:MAG: HAMP domain-containing histidine kinase [Candidatus Lokiarchaeota archaeon]|nr:HAMP domain-containing histidine kinase [Candidatus Lokiarchaeota archaeon]